MRGVVLALDLATRSGWACGAAGGPPAYGAFVLGGADRAARYAALLDWLDDAAKVHAPERIVAEAPMVTGDFRGRDAALLALGFMAHLELWAWDRAMPLQLVHSGTARKGVLGRGSFERGTAKTVVMDWARREGFSPACDNAADALLLWHHATGYRARRELVA